MKTPTIWDPSYRSISDALRAKLETYSPQQLADAVGISKRLVLRAIESGRLECHKAGPRRFVIESRAAAEWWNSLAK